jgi:hypothetical protein
MRSRRAIRLLAAEALLLCIALPVARWLGAAGTWLVWPYCVIGLAALGVVCCSPLLFAAHVRRAVTGMLLSCLASAAIGVASLALADLAYERHLRGMIAHLDRIVAGVESHRRTSGALPAVLAELKKEAGLAFTSDEQRLLCYELLPESRPAAFGISMPCPDPGIAFPLSFGSYLVYRSDWSGDRIKGWRRDLGGGWMLIEAD